jgi:hypothetical protein
MQTAVGVARLNDKAIRCRMGQFKMTPVGELPTIIKGRAPFGGDIV